MCESCATGKSATTWANMLRVLHAARVYQLWLFVLFVTLLFYFFYAGVVVVVVDSFLLLPLCALRIICGKKNKDNLLFSRSFAGETCGEREKENGRGKYFAVFVIICHIQSNTGKNKYLSKWIWIRSGSGKGKIYGKLIAISCCIRAPASAHMCLCVCNVLLDTKRKILYLSYCVKDLRA